MPRSRKSSRGSKTSTPQPGAEEAAAVQEAAEVVAAELRNEAAELQAIADAEGEAADSSPPGGISVLLPSFPYRTTGMDEGSVSLMSGR